jgi:hypothetical protein
VAANITIARKAASLVVLNEVMDLSRVIPVLYYPKTMAGGFGSDDKLMTSQSRCGIAFLPFPASVTEDAEKKENLRALCG